MLKRLTIRNRLILTVGLPIFVIALLAAIAVPTFQTVKVNGPQYDKIADAKTLEADILPPPAYQIEAHLTTRLLIDAETPAQVAAYQSTLAELERDFIARHTLWQSSLKANDPQRASMKQAFDFGQQYFALVASEITPAAKKLLDDSTVREQLQNVFTTELSPLYEQHRKAIDETVRLSRLRQTTLETETNDLIGSRFLLLGGAAAGSIALLLLLGTIVARSISRPVTALTDAATRAAQTELPRIVHAVQNDPNAQATMPRSAFSDGHDELGSLARAFDLMQDTALQLATEQARVRRNVSDNLVNVGRRNQSLLKRTLASLSKMEQEERDSAKLENLFRLDHLSTRMRRNADSLLVLAGAESPRTWTQPAPIADVVRAAIAQIEAYDRVDIGRLEPVRVKGAAIADLSHLIAEMLENATYFSPPSTVVSVTGKIRMDGYLLVISDDGVGMTSEELATANDRLANPQAFEAEPAKVLGLIVVGHLANRLGLSVRLTESVTRGVACQIHMPDAFLESQAPVEASPRSSVSVGVAAGLAPSASASASASASELPQRRPATDSGVPQFRPAPLTPVLASPTGLRPIGDSSPTSADSSFASPTLRTPPSMPNASGSFGARVNRPVASPPPMAPPPGSPAALPTRVRGANLQPGNAVAMPAAERSVSDMRSSLSSLQRGVNAARSANAADRPAEPSGSAVPDQPVTD